MATTSLTISVDSTKVPRILAAFGHADAVTGVWMNATAADITAYLKGEVQQRVAQYESSTQAQATQAAVIAEVW